MHQSLNRYPCPCCGHLTFAAPPGSGAICPACEWEDDAERLEFATTLGGGVDGLTLFEAQRSGAKVHSEVARDPEWRPIDMAIDDFEDVHEPDCRRAPLGDPTVLYYWRPTFWKRA